MLVRDGWPQPQANLMRPRGRRGSGVHKQLSNNQPNIALLQRTHSTSSEDYILDLCYNRREAGMSGAGQIGRVCDSEH